MHSAPRLTFRKVSNPAPPCRFEPVCDRDRGEGNDEGEGLPESAALDDSVCFKSKSLMPLFAIVSVNDEHPSANQLGALSLGAVIELLQERLHICLQRHIESKHPANSNCTNQAGIH
jgi:hypothetical protein